MPRQEPRIPYALSRSASEIHWPDFGTGWIGWNIQNWGPLYVPRRGDIINVTPREATLYRRILEWETGAKITYDWDSMAVFANGRRLTTHRFRHNYYHICGDYSLDSFDSRYWGFVPEEYIIGVVAKIIPPRESK